MKNLLLIGISLLALITKSPGQTFVLHEELDASDNDGKIYFERLNNGVLFRKNPEANSLKFGNPNSTDFNKDFTITYILTPKGKISKLERYIGIGGHIKDNRLSVIFIENKKLKFIDFDIANGQILNEQSSTKKIVDLMKENNLKSATLMDYEIIETYEVVDDKVFFKVKISKGGEYFLVSCFSNVNNLDDTKIIFLEGLPNINNEKSIEEKSLQTEESSKRVWYNIGIKDGQSYYRKRVSYENKESGKVDSSFFIIAKFNPDGKLVQTYQLTASPSKQEQEIVRPAMTTLKSDLYADIENGCFYTVVTTIEKSKNKSIHIRKFDTKNGNLIWYLEKPLGKDKSDTVLYFEEEGLANNQLIFTNKRNNKKYCQRFRTEDLKLISYEILVEYFKHKRMSFDNSFNAAIYKLQQTDQSLKNQNQMVSFHEGIEFKDGSMYYVCPTKDKRLKVFKYNK